MILQFIICMIATLSFAALFTAPKSELVFCGLTGAVGWIAYLISQEYGVGSAAANLIATFVLTVLSRFIASLRKHPATVYLISGIFPLVPGAGIYYTSYYFIMHASKQFAAYGTQTVITAGTIVLGILFGFSLPQVWFNTLGAVHDAKRR